MSLSHNTSIPSTRTLTAPWVAGVLDSFTVLVGLCVLSLGIAICVNTPWGTQPWDVLHLGLAKLVGASLGRTSQVVGGIVVLVTLCLRGKGITWLTLVNVLLIGFEVDMLRPYVPFVSSWGGLLYLEFGIMLVSLGTALYLTPGWGTGPRDSLMLALHQKLNLPIFRIRITLDVGVVLIGWLLGGPVGIGTILAALTTGPWVQLFLATTKRWRLEALKLPH